MSRKILYLTIDDAPSSHYLKKIDFLLQHDIPAVIFCRGIFMPAHLPAVAEAIQKGFWIGNHSYTHPHFSTVSLEEAKEEIIRTETLIEEAYALAGVKRPHRLFRFPYMDKGGENYRALQEFLVEKGFERAVFPHVAIDDDIDISWTFDAREYALFDRKYMDKYKLYGPSDFVAKIERELLQSEKPEVVLFHDFETTHEVFVPMIQVLVDRKVDFRLPEVLSVCK